MTRLLRMTSRSFAEGEDPDTGQRYRKLRTITYTFVLDFLSTAMFYGRTVPNENPGRHKSEAPVLEWP